jgi:hypothetical protein
MLVRLRNRRAGGRVRHSGRIGREAWNDLGPQRELYDRPRSNRDVRARTSIARVAVPNRLKLHQYARTGYGGGHPAAEPSAGFKVQASRPILRAWQRNRNRLGRSTGTVFKIASKAVWPGTVEAASEQPRWRRVEFTTRLMAIRRRPPPRRGRPIRSQAQMAASWRLRPKRCGASKTEVIFAAALSATPLAYPAP